MAQVVGGVVGAAIGFFTGGIYGAVIGFGIGSSLFAGTQKLPVQRIGDIARQTAQEGVARPIIFGRVRPIGGNVIHSQDPVIKRKKQKSGGKGGGGGTETETETVHRTYAIRISEGPITGVMRVWRNNKLVFDNRGTEWGRKNNGAFLKRARIYLGGWDQFPDSNLEAIWGVNNVSAYRGTAYIVIINEDLTDLGGAIPQFLFEVERSEISFVLSSKPFPTYGSENLNVAPGIRSIKVRDIVHNTTDGFEISTSIGSIVVSESGNKYADGLDVSPSISRISASVLNKADPDSMNVSTGISLIKHSILQKAQTDSMNVEPGLTSIGIT